MPALQYWFTPAALFAMGGFALFAILGFASIANMKEQYRKLTIIGYGIAAMLFLLGWWQTAKQEKESSHSAAVLNTLQDSVKKIADSIHVDPNQSATTLAEEILSRLAAQKAPRHLSETEKSNLKTVFAALISVFPTLKIAAPGDGEAQGYAKEFAALFNSIGIKVDRVGFIIQQMPPSPENSLQVVVKSLSVVPPKAERFAEAMNQAGLQVRGATMDTLSDDEFLFVVALK